MINVSKFISENITKRDRSMFLADLEKNHDLLINEIKDKSVLVIGGAGTIGSSYIRALLKYEPSKLYVFDVNENGLTELTRDLRSTYGLKVPDDYKTYPINFSDPIFEKIFRREGPFDIVANFAAHKHVRSEKDIYSVQALIENNVIKARRLLDLLVEFPPKHFFCVSTDKAANPVNIMGGSKKIMEEVIMAYSIKYPITTARFANVAFSNGSLLAGFIDRLMKSQPFSSPSDVKRYFVSPEESGQICLMACVLGKSGDIFFPKLTNEQMMTFSNIADKFLVSLGYEPDYCKSEEEARKKALDLNGKIKKYPVYYFKSDTSGEKSFEEFFTEEEIVDNSSFKALGIVKNAPKRNFEAIDSIIDGLNTVFTKPDLKKEDVVAEMSKFLPNFHHIETGKNLDQKM
ncbi:polysaccharide biosynthesis protein [uncultured Acetobacteroides sp.]|uniref:polysaccharide biosynthesis protein n=1 Tax=uncultured Acetobacteroides sp. TaxID=1760811 RepID=UPI0029F5A2F1|nr:polysaccharide biosynthesis protein [uncultured Acetobacteroides sp.]